MIVNLSFLTHVRNHRLCFIAERAIFAGEEGDEGSELKKPYRWPHSSNVLINQNPSEGSGYKAAAKRQDFILPAIFICFASVWFRNPESEMF